MKKFISFILSISLTFSMLFCSIPVHASGGGGVARTEDGICKFYHDDGTEIPASQYTTTQNYFKKLVEFQLPQIQIAKWLFGIIPNSQLECGFQDSAFLSNYLNKYGITGVDSWQEYCKNNYTYNGTDDSVSVSADASDDLHDALKQYLDTNSPYIYYQTTKYTDVPAELFETGTTYKAFKTLVESKDSGTLFYIDNSAMSGLYYGSAYIIPSSYGLIFQAKSEQSSDSKNYWYDYGFYNDDWVLTQITATSFSNVDFSTKVRNKARLKLYMSTDIYSNNSHIISKNACKQEQMSV